MKRFLDNFLSFMFGVWLALTLGLLILLTSRAFGQEPAPTILFHVDNPKNLTWPAARAEQIFEFVVQQVAQHINHDHPPKLAPTVILILGADAEDVDCAGPGKGDCAHNNPEVAGWTRIELQQWDEQKFADGVALCAATQVLSRREIDQSARAALDELGVDVKTLKESK